MMGKLNNRRFVPVKQNLQTFKNNVQKPKSTRYRSTANAQEVEGSNPGSNPLHDQALTSK